MRTSTLSTVASAGIAATFLANASPTVALVGAIGRRLTPGLVGLGDPGHVALTFDDGPDPASTPLFLDALDRCGVRATFLLLGTMVQQYPAVARQVVSAGHEIGVHGYRHRYMTWRTRSAVRDDLQRSVDLVGEATGVRPMWFRPPYGALTLAAQRTARQLELRPVLWTAWGRDWRPAATPRSVLRDVSRGTLTGGTVLLHDSDCTSAPGSWQSTLGALPGLVELLGERGLRVGPLAEHGL
ncbi:MAG: peptidoglycan-N-acetylglucosamine deacetylase [Acidimicrobiia bacterium]|jgi:peptidoglycan/xylan/chitin deacetylase (PgdA/CDA1 family)|nr:peptidoglycan-N-acetylglucosamine deacetylase [Acidimicrobiia bacterium]